MNDFIGRRSRFRRTMLASTAALSLGMQDVGAWATCVDGSTVPAGGFLVGQHPIKIAANWSPNVFTGTAGSVFVPDSSVYEHNDSKLPLTGGGHNWVFDQGSTLCKVTDIGKAGHLATGWEIPPNNPTDCVILPVIRNGTVTNLGDIPIQGDVITPTCDPALLSIAAPNPANTYFNQLGCSISHGIATTPQTATSFLFVAGIKGGMFRVRLDNVTDPTTGGEAGKTVGVSDYYNAIPEGSLLSNATVSPDGMFAIATSRQRLQAVYGCFNPMGDPGDPSLPINPSFFVPPTNLISCMQVGSNNMAADLTTEFGPDLQPYFGGRRVVMSFNSQPGGPFASSWPNCIWQGSGAASLSDAFKFPLFNSNGCGQAQPDFAFDSALITQPNALIRHGNYMYTGPLGGTIVQFYVTEDPFSHLTNMQFRTLVTGLSIVTGLGIAEDQKSLMIYADPTAIGLAAQEIVTKVPLCEDMGPQAPVAPIAVAPTPVPPVVAGNPPPGGTPPVVGTPLTIVVTAGTPPVAGNPPSAGTPTVVVASTGTLPVTDPLAGTPLTAPIPPPPAVIPAGTPVAVITIQNGPAPKFTVSHEKPHTAGDLPPQSKLPPGVRPPHKSGHSARGHFGDAQDEQASKTGQFDGNHQSGDHQSGDHQSGGHQSGKSGD